LEKVHGHVVFTASISGSLPVENFTDYCMAKATLKMMVKIIAKEEGSK